MRHKKINKRALFIDEFVDLHNKIWRRTYFPHKEVGQLVDLLFTKSRYLGKGNHKKVYHVRATERDLALKVGRKKSIEADMEVYRSTPGKKRKHYAKLYWKTKYCLLQKYGKKVKVPIEEKDKLKQELPHLTDIRDDNIRKVEGNFKVVDANFKRKR